MGSREPASGRLRARTRGNRSISRHYDGEKAGRGHPARKRDALPEHRRRLSRDHLVWRPRKADGLCQPAGGRFTGVPTEDLLDGGWTQVVHADDLKYARAVYFEAVERRAEY